MLRTTCEYNQMVTSKKKKNNSKVVPNKKIYSDESASDYDPSADDNQGSEESDSTFGEDEAGNIYVADHSKGDIYKIVVQ